MEEDMNTRLNRSTLRKAVALAGLAGSLVLMGLNPAAAAGACGKRPCVSAQSVVSAAGDEMRIALEQLEFAGDALTPQSRDAIATLATKWAGASKGALKLSVAADAGLQGSAAKRQAGARAKALKQALVDAGLPAAKVSVKS
jgi:hypothetical protein